MPRGENADQGAPEAVHGTEHAHVFSPSGFLDDSWWHRSYWVHGTMYGSVWQGYYRAGKTAPAGRRLDTPEFRETVADQLAAWAGQRGAALWAVSRADGKTLAELRLASSPIFDGMAAAGGRLYICGVDGVVTCLGE